MTGLLVKTGKDKAVIIPHKDMQKCLKIISKEDKVLADELRLVLNAYQKTALALYSEQIKGYNKALS